MEGPGAIDREGYEAFPDLSFDPEETSGDPVTVTGMSFLHLEDGEIVEAHADYDLLGLLRQIGAVPGM